MFPCYIWEFPAAGRNGGGREKRSSGWRWKIARGWEMLARLFRWQRRIPRGKVEASAIRRWGWRQEMKMPDWWMLMREAPERNPGKHDGNELNIGARRRAFSKTSLIPERVRDAAEEREQRARARARRWRHRGINNKLPPRSFPPLRRCHRRESSLVASSSAQKFVLADVPEHNYCTRLLRASN